MPIFDIKLKTKKFPDFYYLYKFSFYKSIDMTIIKMVYYLIDKPIDKPVKNIKIAARYMLIR